MSCSLTHRRAWHSKQDKLDTRDGWDSVRHLVSGGVPYRSYLHQRHFGGPFNQVTNATTGKGVI